MVGTKLVTFHYDLTKLGSPQLPVATITEAPLTILATATGGLRRLAVATIVTTSTTMVVA